MIFLMFVNLYTSRVILNVLGVDDFGIYNVVGGIVTMFSLISGSISAAISRNITYELGKGDMEKLCRIFSTSLTIQIALSLFISVFAETIGLWFLNEKANISESRMIAANWVFQFSIITFIINLISIPYNATIVAHERMKAFAYISIFEGIAKLGVAFMLWVSPFDELIFYAMLMCLVACLTRIIYGAYCKKNFAECKYRFVYDKEIFRQLFGLAGWNMIGASSGVLREQGSDILLNLFFGTTVNAAKGIASQVRNAVYAFVSNFMTALNPQITKSYASGERDYMNMLVIQGARFSFYILLVISLPIIINTEGILTLWLGQVPDYSINFVRLILLFNMEEALSMPLITAMLATGNIRNYQIIVGGLNLLNLPICYIFLYYGYSPESVFVIEIIIGQLCLGARLLLLRKMIGLSFSRFITDVYLNTLFLTIVASFIPISLSPILGCGWGNLVLGILISLISVGLTVWFIGLKQKERVVLLNKGKMIARKYARAK